MIAVGGLRRKLTLERNMRVGDGGGGASTNWVSVAQLWGSVEVLRGEEFFAEHKVQGRVSHEIVVRYRSDVEPEMRLSMDGRLFQILAVFDPDERRRWLKCLCEEQDL